MIIARERLGESRVEYYKEPITARLFPQEFNQKTIIDVESQDFRIIRDRVIYSGGASACAIVVLEGPDKWWGVYHGCFNSRADIKGYTYEEEADIKTLDDFLQEWNRSVGKPNVAYLFGGGFVNEVSEMTEYRDNTAQLVSTKTDLTPNLIYTGWNNLEEGETGVVVNPSTQTIRVNLT